MNINYLLEDYFFKLPHIKFLLFSNFAIRLSLWNLVSLCLGGLLKSLLPRRY